MESMVLYQLALLLLLHAIIQGDNLAIAQQHQQGPIKQTYRCKEDSGFLSDSQQKHRDSALDSVSSNITVPEYTGFLSTQSSSGKPGDVVNAMMLCPPNIKPEACVDCIKKTVPLLKKNCPKQKEGAGWTVLSNLNSCMVRYAGYEIERKIVYWTYVAMWNPDASANTKELGPAVYHFANKLKEKASDDRRKFATGNVTYGAKPYTLYMSMQCTPDLWKQECDGCLSSGILQIDSEVSWRGRWSGRVMYTGCYVRFAHDKFYP